MTVRRSDGAVTVEVLRLGHARDFPLPAYHSALAAGIDLRAAIAADTPLVLEPGTRAMVPTGIALALPAGYEGQVRPRSGLAARHGITVLNSPGTIDADYRGEIQVILVNLGSEAHTIERSDRIAQLVIQPVVRASFTAADRLDDTERGSGGFGSSGRR